MSFVDSRQARPLPPRLLALLGVVLLHALALWLLAQRTPWRLPVGPHASALRVLLPPPVPPVPALAPRRPLAAPKAPAPLQVPLPEVAAAATAREAPALTVQAAPPASEAPPAPPAVAPLNLRLPRAGGRGDAPPTPAQLAAADARANSPRESAVERMANAFGARGWTVIDLGDGSRKVTGPFGECQIIRPSMVDGIAGHPHAGLLPPRSFSCGGIEKGSLKHERPK